MKFKRILSILLIVCFMCSLGIFSIGDNIVAYAEPTDAEDTTPPTDGGGNNPPPTDGGGDNPPPTDGGGDNPPPTDGGSEGTGESMPDDPHGARKFEHYSYSIDMFWEYLDGYMHRCEPGEKVIAAAETRTSMPAYIFESIKETGTILEIQWNEGETFVIEEVPEYDEKIVSFYFTEIIEMLAAEKE